MFQAALIVQLASMLKNKLELTKIVIFAFFSNTLYIVNDIIPIINTKDVSKLTVPILLKLLLSNWKYEHLDVI